MSIQKPTTALMRRGSTAKPPSPDPLAPISAKTSGPWRKLAEMTGSRFDCFNEQVWPHQDAEGHLHDRASSSLDWMPPARVIAGPRALLTSILLVTRVPCRGSGGWGRTLAHNQRLAPVGRSQVPPARFHASPTNTAIAFPGRAAWSSRRRCASTGGRNNRRRKVRDDVRRCPAPPHPHVVMPDRDVVATPKCAL